MDETIKGQPHHRIICRFAAIFLLATSVVAWFHPSDAQQTKKVPRIGMLSQLAIPTSWAGIEAFRQGLRDLGYIEGKNILVEYRYAEGKLDRVPDLVDELVQPQSRCTCHDGTRHDPCSQAGDQDDSHCHGDYRDPVATGLVDSLARPGGNVTGLTRLDPGFERKTAGTA